MFWGRLNVNMKAPKKTTAARVSIAMRTPRPLNLVPLPAKKSTVGRPHRLG